MGIQGVGAPTTVQTQLVQQEGQKKKPRAWAIATGTAACTGLGAVYGWYGADLKYGEKLDRLKPAEWCEKLGARLANSRLSDDEFNTFWANNKSKIMEPAERAYQRGLKIFKNTKTKWAIIGAAIATLVGGGLCYAAEKREAGMGKVKKVKNNPHVSQIVTTTTGQKIEIPVMMGSTTKVKALSKGRYQITYKPTTPDAKAEKTVITEQELIERYGKFDKQV